MKAKLFIYCLIASAGTMLYSCENRPEPKKILLSHDDSLKICQEFQTASKAAMVAAPLVAAEYKVLRGMADLAYSVENPAAHGTYLTPAFIEPTLNLDDFEKYVNMGAYEGIRVYPCSNSKNEIFFILCHGNKSDNKEADYVILDQPDYSTSGSLPKPNSGTTEPKALHTNYMKNIRIFYFDQQATDSPIADRIKFSRFYDKSEILKFINDNLPRIPKPYDTYKLKIEIGYTPNEFSDIFISRIPIQDPKLQAYQMQGFTTMMKIIDPNGKDLIDPTARYQPNNYQGRYLEVASPCPPRCGVVHE